MYPDPLVEALLASANSTSSAGGPGAPPWGTVVELVVALALIATLGTAITRLARGVVLRAGASRSVATSITQWVGVLMILAAAAVITTVAGVSSYLTALTVSGIAGLAVSLALQNTITNVISGVLMQHDGVVKVGDDIQYGTGGVRGVVVKLSLRTTWLRTKDDVVVTIGNSNLAGGPILNYTSLARVNSKLDV